MALEVGVQHPSELEPGVHARDADHEVADDAIVCRVIGRGRAGQRRGEDEEVLVGGEHASGGALRGVLEALGAVALGPRQVADHLGQALVLVHVGGVGGLDGAEHEPLRAERSGGEGGGVEREPQRGRSVGGGRGGAIGRIGPVVGGGRPRRTVGHEASAWEARGALGGIRRLPVANRLRRLVGLHAEKRLEPVDPRGLLTARASSRERTIGVCSSTPAMWRSARSVSPPSSPRPRAARLGVEDVVHVLAQGHDGRREVALVGGVAEGARVVLHDRPRGIRGPELLEGRVDLDGLEVEQPTPGTSTTSGATLRGRPRSMTSWRICAARVPAMPGSAATDAASSSRPTATSALSTTWCLAVVQVTMMSTPAATAA